MFNLWPLSLLPELVLGEQLRALESTASNKNASVAASASLTVSIETELVSIRSFFNPDATGGYRDGSISGFTDGCLISYSRGNASNSPHPFRGSLAGSRITQRIPGSYAPSHGEAYWAWLETTVSDVRLYLSSGSDNDGQGAGPHFTTGALAVLGIALKSADGHIISFLLSSFADTAEPYETTVADLVAAGQFTQAEYTACRDGFIAGGGQVVIVDTSNSNVDWANLNFIAIHSADVALDASASLASITSAEREELYVAHNVDASTAASLSVTIAATLIARETVDVEVLASAGLTADAEISINIPLLEYADWSAPDGRHTLVLILIAAGSNDLWDATNANGENGELVDNTNAAHDDVLVSDIQVSRVRWQNGQLIVNSIGGAQFSAYFSGSAPSFAAAAVHLKTRSALATFTIVEPDELLAAGGHFLTLGPGSADDISVVESINTDDRFLLAFTMPAVDVSAEVAVSASLTAEIAAEVYGPYVDAAVSVSASLTAEIRVFLDTQTFDTSGAVPSGGGLDWTGSVAINGSLVVGGGPAFLRRLRYDGATDFLFVQTSSTSAGSPTEAGPDFTAEVEEHGVFTLHQTGGPGSLAESISFDGPAAAGSVASDATEPYKWRPSNLTALRTWVNQLTAGTQVSLTIEAIQSHDIAVSASAALASSAAAGIVEPIDVDASLAVASGALVGTIAAIAEEAGVDIVVSASGALTASVAAEMVEPIDVDASLAVTSGALSGTVAAIAEQAGVDVLVSASGALTASVAAEMVEPIDVDASLAVTSGALSGTVAAIVEVAAVLAAVSASGSLSGTVAATAETTYVDASSVGVTTAALATQLTTVVGLVPPTGVLENVVQARIGNRNASPITDAPTLDNHGRIPPSSLRISKGVNSQGTANFQIVTFSDQLGTTKPIRGDVVVITARKHDEPLVDGHDFRSYLEGLSPTTFYGCDEGYERGAVPAGFARHYANGADFDMPGGNDPYTAHLFVRFDDISTRSTFYIEGRSQVTGNTTRQWRVSFPANDQVRLDLFTGTQRTRRTYDVGADFSAHSTFYQIAVRVDASGGVSFVFDGDVIQPSASSMTPVSGYPETIPDDTLRVDSQHNGAVVDEVSFWNSIVDDDDLKTLHTIRGVRRLFGGLVRAPIVDPIGNGDLSMVTVNCKSFATRAHELKIEGYVRTLTDESVGELAKTIVNDHMADEGISLAGVRDATAIKGDVWDYISPGQAFSRICEQANAVWCIDDYRTLWIVGRDSIYDGGFLIQESDLLKPTLIEDDRRLRTVQTVIGGSPQSGQERDSFTGDSSTREFRLQFRLDRIIEVSINGVSVDLSATNAEWSIDTKRSIIKQAASATPLDNTQELSVLYNYNFPIVVTRTNSTALAKYGKIHAVHTDSSLDRVDLAENVAETMLDRHDAPTLIVRAGVKPGAVFELREGWGMNASFPKLQLPYTLYLIDRINISLNGFLLMYGVDLLSRDHEPRYEDFWTGLQRRPIPSELTARIASTTSTPGITPEQLGVEGLRLPVVLGGHEYSKVRKTSWTRVPGTGIAVLNAARLPSNLVQWYLTAQCFGGTTAQFRLYNKTLSQQVGLAVQTSTTDADIVFHRRLTLSSGINEYELQCRCTSAAVRGAGVAGWGSAIDVGDF